MHPAPKRQEYSSGVLPLPHVQASLFMKVYHNPPKSRLALVFYPTANFLTSSIILATHNKL